MADGFWPPKPLDGRRDNRPPENGDVTMRNLTEGEAVHYSHGVRYAVEGDTLMTIARDDQNVSAVLCLDPETAVEFGKALIHHGREGRWQRWRANRRFEKNIRKAMKKALVK